MIKVYFRDCSTWLRAIDELVDMDVAHTVSEDGRDFRGRYKIEVAWSSGD